MGKNKEIDQDVTEDELTKAMDALSEAAEYTEDEKQSLLSKAMEGDISPEENDRLADLLAGRRVEDTLEEEITKSLSGESDERLEKALDVSEYLEGLHGGVVDALGKLADHLEKSDGRQHTFNVALAKGVCALGELAKSLDGRLATVEEQPAGQPKSMQLQSKVKQHLAKSFAGENGGEEKLSKSQVLDTLEEMHLDSLKNGGNGMSKSGEDINEAITKYENTNRLSRPMAAALTDYRQKTMH